MDPFEYLKAFRRRWTVITGAIGLALIAGWVTTSVAPVQAPKPFYSSTTVLLSPGSASGATLSAGFAGVGNLNTLAALATVGEIPARVAKIVDYQGEPSQLAQTVQAFADVETGLLRITASSADPMEATAVSDAFGEQLVQFLKDKRLESLDKGSGSVGSQMDRLRQEIESLDRRIAESPTDQILIAQRDAKVRQFGLLYEQYQQLATAASESVDIQIVQRGEAQVLATQGFQPPQTRTSRLLLAGGLGLFTGLAIALLLERFDTRIRSKAAAEKHFALPVLGEIPHIPRKARRTIAISGPDVRSPVADSFRFLAAALALSKETSSGVFGRNQGRIVSGTETTSDEGSVETVSTRNGRELVIRKRVNGVQVASTNGSANGSSNGMKESASGHAATGPTESTGPRTILITSPGPDEGKTTTVANLAAAFGELGQRVIVLSCDFRRPTLHEHFGVPNEDGLADALSSELSGPILNGNVRVTGVKNVSLLPSGAPSVRPGELLSSSRMRSALEEARANADVVLLDTPPLMTAGEATLLLREVDAVLVLARAGKTTADSAERTAEVLKRLDAPVIGAALTDSENTTLPYYYPIRESRRGFPRLARHSEDS